MAHMSLHGKKSKTKLLLETKTNFSGAHLSQARTVLACSTDLALAVLAGTKALDAAYGEAKKAKQQLDGKGVAKSRRAAKMRRRKRSAGDHNHAGPHAENPEPGDTPEVIRDRAYTWQAGESLRLAHENKLAPIDPEEVIRAARLELPHGQPRRARRARMTRNPARRCAKGRLSISCIAFDRTECVGV
jgi:hypothetical protein